MAVLEHLDERLARPLFDELVAVYLDVYASKDNGVYYSEGRYRRQLDGHMKAPGWEIVTASHAGQIIGYMYGFTRPAGSRWWDDVKGQGGETFTAEARRSTFAVCELLVAEPWQRQGIARHLHDELLSARPEEQATLLVDPGNTTAQTIYAHWGWHKIGKRQPRWEGITTLDVLMLPLHRPAP